MSFKSATNSGSRHRRPAATHRDTHHRAVDVGTRRHIANVSRIRTGVKHVEMRFKGLTQQDSAGNENNRRANPNHPAEAGIVFPHGFSVAVVSAATTDPAPKSPANPALCAEHHPASSAETPAPGTPQGNRGQTNHEARCPAGPAGKRPRRTRRSSSSETGGTGVLTRDSLECRRSPHREGQPGSFRSSLASAESSEVNR